MPARSTGLANCGTPFFTDEEAEIRLAEFHVIRPVAQLPVFRALKNSQCIVEHL